MIRKTVSILLMVCMVFSLASCKGGEKYTYGVFLGADPEDMDEFSPYETIVIDAQYFSKSEISEIKDDGHTVYSYINLGSVEEFRDYFDDYEYLTLGVYENWEDERWVDVSDPSWQTFIMGIAEDLVDKGVDGLFVDNVDVYYNYPTDEIFDGVASILKSFQDMDTYVSINGGDCFMTEYASRYGNMKDVADAINQETVFSCIDWDDDSFGTNSSSESRYFREYVESASSCGLDIYLLEYTTDKDLIEQIDIYCARMGFSYYASDSLDLVTPGQAIGSQKI